MKNSTVWLYWENAPGRELPAHIELCHRILASQEHGCNVVVVTPGNVNQYLPDLDPAVWDITLENIDQNPIAVRCAFIRAFLLEKYGSLYVDSDCLALVDYKSVFDEVAGFDFFAMRRTSAKTNHISIGFYGSVKLGVVISKYCDALRAILKKKTLFKWAEVGAHLVTPIVNEHLDRCYLFREDRIHPVVAEKQELLADEVVPVGEVVPNDAVTLMLFHRIFEQKVRGVTLKDFSTSDLEGGNSLLSRVIKQYALV